jgi:hypothetical protein
MTPEPFDKCRKKHQIKSCNECKHFPDGWNRSCPYIKEHEKSFEKYEKEMIRRVK